MTISLKSNPDGLSGAIQVNGVDAVGFDNTGITSGVPASQAPLVSGTNIKTVNSTSLLGAGDVAVQPTLVSGTNIKTVGGFSLLGSGDIPIDVYSTGDVVISSDLAKYPSPQWLECNGNTVSLDTYTQFISMLSINRLSLETTGTISSEGYGQYATPVAFSLDGSVLAATGEGFSASPYINVYFYNVTTKTYELQPNNVLDVAIPSVARCVAISSDGTYLYVGLNTTTNGHKLYKKTANTYVLQATLPSAPAQIATSCKFSDDDKFLFLGLTTAPATIGYSINAGVFALDTTIPDIPAAAVKGLDTVTTDDGTTFLVTSMILSPFVKVWKALSGSTTFSNVSLTFGASPTSIFKVSISKNAKYILVGDNTTAYSLSIFLFNGTSYSRITTSNLPDFGDDQSIISNPTDDELTFVYSTQTGMNIYKLTGSTLSPNLSTTGLGRSFVVVACEATRTVATADPSSTFFKIYSADAALPNMSAIDTNSVSKAFIKTGAV